jgi:small subunit ribosomal protein S17
MPEETETPTQTEAAAATVAAAPAPAAKAVAAAPAADEDVARRKNRKTREGLVVSDKMDKTAVVAVIERVRHAKYGKFMMRTKRLYAHDETNDANTGDRVRVMETRPLSKNKRWRVVEVLERAK